MPHATAGSRAASSLLIAGVGVLLGATAATAHVGVAPAAPVAGTATLLEFSFSHGCDGAPTDRVTIRLPEDVLTATPQAHPGWDVSVSRAKLPEPVEGAHGATVTERVTEIVFTAAEPVADGVRDTLGLNLTFAEELAGTTLAFPTVQRCTTGANDWVQIAAEGVDPHSLDMPAPVVTVGTPVVDHAPASTSTSTSTSTAQSSAPTDESGTGLALALGAAGLCLGAVGALLGATALKRTRQA